MRINKITRLFVVYIFFVIIVGCSKDYQVDFSFTGTIQEKLTEEKMLVMKENGGEYEGRREGNIYEIPVENIEQYNVGQKLKITVLSNTDKDIWDLDHMKFEIEQIED
jgi:hypothetical protein